MKALKGIICLGWTVFLLLVGMLSAGAAPVVRVGEQASDGGVGKLTITVDRQDLSIAESLALTVEVLVPKGLTATLPDFSEYGFALDFNERSHRFRATDVSPEAAQQLDDGSVRLTQSFTLEPWLSGDYAILPMMIPFYAAEPEGPDREGGLPYRVPVFSVMTEAIRIKVTPLSLERQEFADNFGPADFTLENLRQRQRRPEDKSDEELKREEQEQQEAAEALQERQFPWRFLLGALLVLAVVPVVLFLFRKRVRQFLTARAQPAHEIAYTSLAELAAKGLLEKGLVREYYYDLSYILRIYIGNRFGIYAAKQTTEEFFGQLLRENPFDREGENILREFSDHADTVKYSLYRPDKTVAEKAWAIARSFIDKTKRQEEAADGR